MADAVSVLIVDDEPLARRGLRRIIESIEGCAVAAECRDGVEALEAIARLRPAVVLLDIEMPGMGAFDVLESLDERSGPAVILVTAYGEHGLAAFDAGAIDYVLKPVEPERLERALERARQRAASPPKHLTRVVAKLAGRTRVLAVEEIEWIEAAGSYVRLHAAQGEVLHRESLARMAERLDPAEFIRVHRSTIVALRRVAEVVPAGHGDAKARLHSGQVVTVSRRFRSGLVDRLEGRG